LAPREGETCPRIWEDKRNSPEVGTHPDLREKSRKRSGATPSNLLDRLSLALQVEHHLQGKEAAEMTILEGAAMQEDRGSLIDLLEVSLAEIRAHHSVPLTEEDQAEEAAAAEAEAEETIPRPPAIAGLERSSPTWLPELHMARWFQPLNRN
jgi:hypothetical protein